MYSKSAVAYRLQSRPTNKTADGRPWRYEGEADSPRIIKNELRLLKEAHGDSREYRILHITRTVTWEEVTL